MAKRPVRLEAFKVGSAQAASNSVQLRIMPGNWKRNGGVQQRAEIERIVGVLPEIISVDQQELSDSLLEARIELIAETRLNRHSRGAKYVLRQSADPSRARQQQVLIERCFEGARVGCA